MTLFYTIFLIIINKVLGSYPVANIVKYLKFPTKPIMSNKCQFKKLIKN